MTYHVLSDPQGNVVGLAAADGTLVVQYDCDSYGRLIRQTGPKSTSCPFRYSTKYSDPDLELYYCGYRWYDAAAMKWLTPNPIGEPGRVNVIAFSAGVSISCLNWLELDLIINESQNRPKPHLDLPFWSDARSIKICAMTEDSPAALLAVALRRGGPSRC